VRGKAGEPGSRVVRAVAVHALAHLEGWGENCETRFAPLIAVVERAAGEVGTREASEALLSGRTEAAASAACTLHITLCRLVWLMLLMLRAGWRPLGSRERGPTRRG